MKLATTTGEFVEYKSCPQRAVQQFKGTNFRYLDFNFCESVYKGSSFVEDGWEKMIKETGEEAEKIGKAFCQAHSPDWGRPEPIIGSADEDDFIKYTNRSIEACGMLGIKEIVVHGISEQLESFSAFVKKNKAYYERFFSTAEKYGVNILTENTPVSLRYMRTGAEMRELIEAVNHPLFHACWDTGHGNVITDNQYPQIVDLGEELHALHIHDNDGTRDAHSLPYTGNCNFDAVMQALLDINYKGYFTFESTRLLLPGRLRRQWEYNGEQVTKAVNPTGELRHAAVILEYEVGKFILSKYNCFEE